MDFRRYDDFAGNTKQKKIDKLLKKCPFCGENPHWLLKLEYGKTTLTCKCEKCGGELYTENYNLNSQSAMIAISTGKSNSNNLELNSSYSILYLATLQNINEEKEFSALKKRIIELHLQGMYLPQIQKKLSLSSAYLNCIVTKLKRSGEWPEVDRTFKKEEIAKAIAEGMTSTVELCDTFGITEETLKTYKSQMGIKTGRPKRNYRHCERTNAIYEDLKAGVLTTAEIARKHGVKWQSVHKLRKKLEEDLNNAT